MEMNGPQHIFLISYSSNSMECPWSLLKGWIRWTEPSCFHCL